MGRMEQIDIKGYSERFFSVCKFRSLAIATIHEPDRAVFVHATSFVILVMQLRYQGLGTALTGGLAFSTILTPTVVPALMALLHDFDCRRKPS